MSERHNVEWKLRWKDEYLKGICAFANSQGGRFYVGKDDEGHIVGVDNHQRLLEDIPSKIQNHLGIVCDVNLLEQGGHYFLELVVPPYDVPVSFRGKYYLRSGSTTRELQGASLHDFLLRKVGKSWGDVLEFGASYDDYSSP